MHFPRMYTSGKMPTMNVFFHELMAIMPRSWKPGDNPPTTPLRNPPPPSVEEDAAASVQLGKTHRAGIGPAAPASKHNTNRAGTNNDR